MLIKNAEINGEIADVQFERTITSITPLKMGESELGPGSRAAVVPTAQSTECELDAQGCALLPGLHDHHLHYFAASAAKYSVDCHPQKVSDIVELGRILAAADGAGWLRGVNYHESTAGELDQFALEDLVPGRPVRLQHSSGKFWMFNTTACRLLDLQSAQHSGVERDHQGRPTGRIFRMDQWLHEKISQQDASVDLNLAEELLALGITSFTDASFTNSADNIPRYMDLPQSVYAMGDETLAQGHYKIMLDENALPMLDDLAQTISAMHDKGRPVAFHCISRIELLYALAVLKMSGSLAQDRIEHGAMIPAECIAELAALGLTVVTQPGFLIDRGDRFFAELDDAEKPDLYRFQTLLDAGVSVVASSDAPYGPVSPWKVVQAASTRHSETGQVLGAQDIVLVEAALAGYLTSPLDPAGMPRVLAPGNPATMILLTSDLATAMSGIGDVQVRNTFISGQMLYARA